LPEEASSRRVFCIDNAVSQSMANGISTLASVDSRAQIEPTASIGPYCVVGPEVRIGHNCRLESGVTLTGRVTVGDFNHFFPGAVVGESQLDDGQDGAVIVGNHNTIREGATILPGVEPTTIGNHNFLMANCQIGNECQLRDHISIANGSNLERRVTVEDHAVFSGRVLIREGLQVGNCSFVSIGSHVVRDVPPFVIVEGNPARTRSLNIVGLTRNGFSSEVIRALNTAYRIFFRSQISVDQVPSVLELALQDEPRVQDFLDFVNSHPDWRN
jgi:UDP-N-acetylglucosamine acyltransferase